MSADSEIPGIARDGEGPSGREPLRGPDLIRALAAHAGWLRGGTGEPPDLTGVDLRNNSFEDRQLQEARLRRANLEGCDLSSANLRGADLCRANLRNTRFQHPCPAEDADAGAPEPEAEPGPPE